MKDIPRVGFVCTGENALELSGAICCAGRFMRLFTENGYMTGGCYSCISPSKQMSLLKERIGHMCACNDVVVTIGCDGFRTGDVIPDIYFRSATESFSTFRESCRQKNMLMPKPVNRINVFRREAPRQCMGARLSCPFLRILRRLSGN